MGDATAYRVDEGAAIPASSPVTGGLTFTAKKLAGMIIATTETIEDANVGVINWMQQLLGEAISYKEDEWAFLGLAGTEGIARNATCPVYTLGSGDTDFADIDLDDMLGALGLIDESCVGNAKWLMSWNVLNHFRSLKNVSTGQYYLQAPAGTMPTSIWGMPYVTSPVMPKTTQEASQADGFLAALYDPRYLMIGDRRSVSLEFSKEATVVGTGGATLINLFQQDMVAVKVTERIDIQLALPEKSCVRIETAAS
jgi:HK97 family phage major capsid protein